jgi:hypothetical protein
VCASSGPRSPWSPGLRPAIAQRMASEIVFTKIRSRGYSGTRAPADPMPAIIHVRQARFGDGSPELIRPFQAEGGTKMEGPRTKDQDPRTKAGRHGLVLGSWSFPLFGAVLRTHRPSKDGRPHGNWCTSC